MSTYYSFSMNTNNAKPITIDKTKQHTHSPCPFCDYEELAKNQEVFKVMDQSLLVANLYPTVQGTIQTVFIETKDCDASFLTYDRKTTVLVLRNFFESYRYLCEKHPTKQVIGFKNSGPYSSGSIHHQHMQLYVIDQPLQPKGEHIFEGLSVYEQEGISINVSTKPSTELYEINCTIQNDALYAYGATFDTFCLLLQQCIHFALTDITQTNSYNLAFYFNETNCTIKLLPRIHRQSVSYSPLFLAFDMHLVPDNLAEMSDQLAEALEDNQ